MKKGFTLVELSIVLVIIGLLIGGILVAQSMIGTSKIVATAAQIQQFDAGVMSFKAKYNTLPGDARALGGDADGYLSYGYGYPDITCEYHGEIANFWNNIDSSKFPNTYSGAQSTPGTAAIPTGASPNVPFSKLGKNGSYVIAIALTSVGGPSADTTSINKGNYYAIMDKSNIQTTTGGNYRITTTSSTNSPVTPADLLALDKKIDDSIANTGNVLSGRAGNYSGNGWGGIEAAPATGICSSGATYTVSNPGYECTPLIRIGGIAGDPQ